MPDFTYSDVEAIRKTGVVDNYVAEYDPDAFWSDIGERYWKSFTDVTIKKNMPDLCSRIVRIKPETVLEVGCGFGRCISFVYNVLLSKGVFPNITGIDFSRTMVETSKTFYHKYDNRDKINIQVGDARDLQFHDRSFDLTYTHVCLTHIPPKFIQRVVEEISRVTREWIIHIERFAFPFEHPNHHRWSHLLAPLYLDLGWEIYENLVINKEDSTNLLVLRKAQC